MSKTLHISQHYLFSILSSTGVVEKILRKFTFHGHAPTHLLFFNKFKLASTIGKLRLITKQAPGLKWMAFSYIHCMQF